ncbi:unnamed protein product [Enterobius vermicularis]|uniref:Neur_chan_memb domain-containing protein n=1 Tax=Enterobius vermicularis TaxID=51028 RepID=A0A0N4VL57_ENTVE|nr:unnamed protein product [Enterobius vermicularis]
MRYLLLDLIPYVIMLKKPRHLTKTDQLDVNNLSTVMRTKDNANFENKLLPIEFPCFANCKQHGFNSFVTPFEDESEAVFHSIYRGICDACKDLNLINKEFIAMRQQFEEQRQDRLEHLVSRKRSSGQMHAASRFARRSNNSISSQHRIRTGSCTAIELAYKSSFLESNWRFAAMVVDRLCLFLFTIFITVATGVILLPFLVKETQ